MSLYQRLHETPADAPSGPGRDPLLDELRRRVHHLLIDELGPLLYDRRVGEEELSVAPPALGRLKSAITRHG